MKVDLKIPDRESLIDQVSRSLFRYWTNNISTLSALPIKNCQNDNSISIPLRLVTVNLPSWARDCGVNGALLVPRECIPQNSQKVLWNKVDWWLAMFLLLEGWHERLWERINGVIHSYSFRLKGWDTRAWDHAWVNRIAIFLGKWLARVNDVDEGLTSSDPISQITITHDVDAIEKTVQIRMKQGAFNLFNALKLLTQGKILHGASYLGKGLRFLCGKGDWNRINELMKMEEKAGISAIYHFYADNQSKTLKGWLFDPSYDVRRKEIKLVLSRLLDAGHEVGLHPSFDTWRDSQRIAAQRKVLEENALSTVSSCRQHWLRFSWDHTWAAQSKSGVKKDSTLIFNDRSGFRNSACLSWNPWNPKMSEPHRITSINTILMDSHLYDYNSFTKEEREAEIIRWTKECRSVLGQCYLLWHPHTLNEEYGWRGGLKCLLNEVTKTQASPK